MREPNTVSALVIARDEEAHLAECLSALDWADERIVVVDSRSRDNTLEIARARADQVVVRPFDDFASQRNAGLDLARGRWIFAVDADERSSPQQGAEIRGRFEAEPEVVGFRVPIRSVVLGRPFRYSGTQLDLPLRLFRRDLGRWTGQVHETVDLEGPIGRIELPLEHDTIPDMTTFLRKIDHYTTLEARKLAERGRDGNLFVDLAARPAWLFLKLYLYRQGWRDGAEGFAFCAMSAVSAAVRAWKVREVAA